MSEAAKPDSANTSSIQSTPTPPNSGQSTRSRRSARKCATPIKSAEKVGKGERVTIPQLSLSDTSSTNNTVTPPDSTQQIAKAKPNPIPTPSATPIRRRTTSTPRKKGRKRIPFTLVEASKGNRCPTPGCNGHGHVTGLYAMHYAVSGCPIAARNKSTGHKVQSKDGSPIPLSSDKLSSPNRRKKRKRSRVAKKRRHAVAKKETDLSKDISLSTNSEMSDGECVTTVKSEDASKSDIPPAHRLRSSSTGGVGELDSIQSSNTHRKRKKPCDSSPESSISYSSPSSSSSFSSPDEKTSLVPATTKKKRFNSSSTVDYKPETAPSPQSSAFTPSHITSSYFTPTSDHPKKKKRIPYTLVEASKGNHCPTEGCEGHGHITGMYAMHFAVSGCPKAHGKTAEECKARREELNRLRNKSMPQERGEDSGSGGCVVLGDRSLRRTQRASIGGLVVGGGEGGSVSSLSMSRKMNSQYISASASTGGLPAPQLARITQLHGLLINSKPLGYLRGDEPKLEGITPTLDLSLFREAQQITMESLGQVEDDKNTIPNYQLKTVEFGSHEIDTWYTSPYPANHTRLPKLYICEFCLKYFKSSLTLRKHVKICSWHHPPGNEIYRHQSLSFFEVDGEKHKVYCQHLCLMAKLFLENKTLYFDVEPFLFYVLTQWDMNGAHMLGYFSKEKHSSQSYNLSCIVVLPQHMRKGYGHLMIDFSYLLTRREEKVGSPERPLSDLGLVSYRSYWKDVILTYILRHNNKSDNFSIKEMSLETGLNSDDIVSTLQFFSMLKYWKGKHIVLKRKDLLEEHSKKLERQKGSARVLDDTCLQWTPESYPIYT